jgi:hypothetical protein
MLSQFHICDVLNNCKPASPKESDALQIPFVPPPSSQKKGTISQSILTNGQRRKADGQLLASTSAVHELALLRMELDKCVFLRGDLDSRRI